MKNNKIGLVLASIHTGAAQNVWPSFVRTALIEDKSLFIFPGGRLNAPMDAEYLRNPIYSLVNSENLDGFISWSSTIRYTESKEEFEQFHSRFDTLPYVTLTYKIPGRPCVEFDSYNGMKQLTAHCINFHGARKIAFLRGPDFNSAALPRLKGYEDALREAGLPVMRNNPLITDPFNWNNGDAAAAQLFETRKLLPGRDFDTLIGASDLMTLGAINYLSRQGYHVPNDYHALGFNNSAESMLAESPLSTVHIPYAALSSESFRILINLLKNRKIASAETCEDILLPSEPIIRESCGCGSTHFLHTETDEKNLTAMIAAYLKLGPQDANALAAPLVSALFAIQDSGGNTRDSSRSVERFLNLLKKALPRFFGSYRDSGLLFSLLESISHSGLVDPGFFGELEPLMYRTIFKVSEQRAVHAQYEKEKWNTALNSLKCELLGTRDRISLVQSLARHLPKIGINAAGIALFRDSGTSLWAGSFSPEGVSLLREQSFPARRLVPEQFDPEFSRGIFMVQPLFVENQSLGYFIHTVPIYDGVIFEELRSSVSYALKGIFQLEEVIRAKRIAEQAEKEKTEFLKTLENELHNPLTGMMEKIERTGSLIDVTLSHAGERTSLKEFDGIDTPGQTPKKGAILLVGDSSGKEFLREPPAGQAEDVIHIPSMSVFNETVAEITPQMVIFGSLNPDAAPLIRRHPITVTVPIVMTSSRINSAADVMTLSQYSRLLICHDSVASSPEFRSRLRSIREGDEILPPHTGALVKKTILYLDQHHEAYITRWKLAEAVYVNEDYLTRIFHREMGLPLWDYLNRLRIFHAADLLLETDETIQGIAFRSGFQDHAYFCRVFRKIYGISPGQLRKNLKKSE